MQLDFASLILLTYVLSWFGLGKRFPFELLGPSGAAIGAWFWGLVTLAWVISALRAIAQNTSPHVTDATDSQGLFKWCRPLVILGCIMVAAMDLVQWKHFRHLGYPFPKVLLLFDIVLIIVVFWKLMKVEEAPLTLAWVGSAIHKGLSILTFPIIAERSDMLLAITESGTRFINGGNPYAPSELGIGRMPYLPLTWISYLPAAILKIDPRWLGLAFFIALGYLAQRFIEQDGLRNPLSRGGEQTYEVDTSLPGRISRLQSGVLQSYSPSKATRDGKWLLVFWFLSPYLAFRHDLYMDFFWLLCFLSTIAALRGRAWLTSIMAGFALATLQFAWVIAPFWWMVATKSEENQSNRWSRLAFSVLFSLVVAAFFVVPFMMTNGADFRDAIFMHLAKVAQPYYGELCLGFAPLLYLLKIQWIRMPLQLGMLILLGLWALRIWNDSQQRNSLRIGQIGVVAFFMFLQLNHFIENYFYLTPLLMGSVVLLPRQGR